MTAKDFLGGVVEGFYGQPWTHNQRLTLFDKLVSWGLNTYFYAPKDDLKHRARWRENYNEAEIDRLGTLVDAAQKRDVRFIYGISPGLDIRFSQSEEIETLRRRLQQMMDVGVVDFAILFDDIPARLTESDQARFGSNAKAQSHIANAMFEWLRKSHPAARMLFCPTPYCDRMDRANVGGEGYLDQIGQSLASEIDVLWTGPEIISEDIPAASIHALASRIGRRPVIWDNLHANDYDMRRLYCGPYSRSNDLRDLVSGILSNPNNEFAINHVPLSTLGRFVAEDDYQPSDAYRHAVVDWSAEYQTYNGAVDHEDLGLLTDCYYLPHSHGQQGVRLEQLATTLIRQSVDQWGNADDEFKDASRRLQRLFDKLTELDDRDLFYAWSRRVWELREELELIEEIARRRKRGESFPLRPSSHFPWTYRGGIAADLQRPLMMTHDGEVLPT